MHLDPFNQHIFGVLIFCFDTYGVVLVPHGHILKIRFSISTTVGLEARVRVTMHMNVLSRNVESVRVKS